MMRCVVSMLQTYLLPVVATLTISTNPEDWYNCRIFE